MGIDRSQLHVCLSVDTPAQHSLRTESAIISNNTSKHSSVQKRWTTASLEAPDRKKNKQTKTPINL